MSGAAFSRRAIPWMLHRFPPLFGGTLVVTRT
jgi:hypothetical protein